MERYKELRSILLHPEEAHELLPTAVQANAAMNAVDTSGQMAEGLGFAFKGAEVLGLAQDPKRFREYMDSFIKAQQVMGKTITPEQQYEFAKFSKASGATLSDRFKMTTGVSLAQELGAHVLGHCDVTDCATIDKVFAEAGKLWGAIDFVVHCIAFSDKDQLTGRYVDTTEDNFTKSLAISCYSFTAVAQRAEKLMPKGGSMLTLTYYGAEKWMPHYNVMGVAKAALEASTRYLAYDLGPKKIRVNCISAGPVNTLAARGIAGFTDMLKHYEAHAPLKRNVLPDELGATGTFLASDGAAAITGQVLYVDCGYQIMGM